MVKQKANLDTNTLINSIILAASGTAAVLLFSPYVATMVLCLMFLFALCLGADYADFTLPDLCTSGIVIAGIAMSTSTSALLHSTDAAIGGRAFLAGGILESIGGAVFGFVAMLTLAKLASLA